MDLTIFDIIQGPVLTDKASMLGKKFKKIVLKVHPKANKPLIAEALKKLFNVEVAEVRIIVRKGKARSYKRIASVGKTVKRAIVTLKPGYSLDVGEAEAQVVNQPEAQSAS